MKRTLVFGAKTYPYPRRAIGIRPDLAVVVLAELGVYAQLTFLET